MKEKGRKKLFQEPSTFLSGVSLVVAPVASSSTSLSLSSAPLTLCARQESGGSPTPFARFDGRYALNSLVAAGARGCLKPDAASPMAMGEEGWAAASFASVGRRDPAAPPSPTRRAFRGATAAAARERASWGQLLAAA